MQRLEVSGAVRPLYGVVRRQRVNCIMGSTDPTFATATLGR